jgi:hypothetical protein
MDSKPNHELINKLSATFANDRCCKMWQQNAAFHTPGFSGSWLK